MTFCWRSTIANAGRHIRTQARRLQSTGRRVRPLTKLVTTIGPASEEYEPLSQCVASGMNVMRLNFSHATPDEFFLRINNLAKAEGGEYVATLLDTRGPEIRMGGLRVCKERRNRKAKVKLQQGHELVLTTDAAKDGDGDERCMFVNYPLLAKKLTTNDSVLLDDGAITLRVVEVLHDQAVRCTVENTGMIGERKGVNLPGIALELPAMSEKDEADIKFGVEHGIDIVAASFVHDGHGVVQIRRYVEQCVAEVGGERYAGGETPLIVAKIESFEALRNLDEIIDSSDGIMIARGDLGVEVPLVQVCQRQKEIVDSCRVAGKPCIVATQMLDSMAGNPRPTRAEVADVTNAVIERADAVMLSGESANGEYPVLSVQTQREICETSETWLFSKATPPVYNVVQPLSTYDAVAFAAVSAQRATSAQAIVVKECDNGKVARSVARFAPDVPIVALCDSTRIARQLALSRGVFAKADHTAYDAATPAVLVAFARTFLGLTDADAVVALHDRAVSMPP